MIRQIIAADKNLVTYRPALREIGGSIAGTVLLQQIIYWDEKQGGKFYKFAEPPKNPSTQKAYKTGDSWKEELGMTAKELRTALSHFAFKCGSKNKAEFGEEYESKRDSALVQYYTDSQRITWYKLNRSVLNKLLLGIYKVSDGVAFTNVSDQPEFTNTESTTETTTDITTPSAIASAEELFNQSKKDPVRTDKDVARRDEFSYTEDFSAFWDSYPRKVGKGDAFEQWNKIKGRPPVDEIVQSVKKQQRSEQWTKDGGQFIPHPSTWLHQRRWEDEVDVRKSEKPYGYQ